MPKGNSKKQTKKQPSIKDIAPFMWVWMVVDALICLLLLPSTMNILKSDMSDPVNIYYAFFNFSLIIINILPICFIVARYQRKSVAWFCLVRGLYLGYVSLTMMGQHDILGASQIGGMMGFCIMALDLYASYYFFSSEKAKDYFIETKKKKSAK